MGKVIAIKGGGTISNNLDKLMASLKFVDQHYQDGNFPVPVFSALKGPTQIDYVNGTTDLCERYRRVILGESSFDKGIRLFENVLRESHFDLINKMGLGGGELEGRVKGIITSAVDTARVLAGTPPGEVSEAQEAYLLSLGEVPVVEIISAFVNELFRKRELSYQTVPVPNIGLITNDNWKDAEINSKRTIRGLVRRISSYKKKNIVPIVAGYNGNTYVRDGGKRTRFTTVLSRGGSDLTAISIASALELARRENQKYSGVFWDGVEVYLLKDTPGVLSANPNIVTEARRQPSLTYGMASEAGNIQSKSVRPAEEIGLPLCIMDPCEPDKKTMVGEYELDEGLYVILDPEKCVYISVKAIPNVPDAFHSFLGEYFRGRGVNIEEVGHMHSHTGFVINRGVEKLDTLVGELERHGFNVQSVVGNYSFRAVGVITPDLSQRFNSFLLQYLQDRKLGMPIKMGWWERGINALTCTLPGDRLDPYDFMRALHDEFVIKGV